MKVVISGASKGIGRALTLKFAQNGAEIAVCSRNPDNLKNLEQELQNSHPKSMVHFCKADMSIEHDVKRFAGFCLQKLEYVDVLINNAGYFVPGQLLTEPKGTLQQMLDSNLFSAYHLSRAVLPAMIERKSGHIFNICSIASIAAYANGGAYSISKFALLGFSKNLREEMKPHGIKVTSVLPGATLTDSWSGTTLPPDRFIQAEDIASLIWQTSQLSASATVEEIVIRPQLGDL